MMMNKLSIAAALSALLWASGISAQTDADTKKTINNIKKSSQYIYAEATAATAQEAKDIAEEMLNNEINAWVASKKKAKAGEKSIVASNRRELWANVELSRGNMVRSFMYVKKSDVLTVENAEVIANTAPVPEKQEMASTVQTVYPDVVQKIAACTAYADMAALIKQYKQEGKLTHYARYAQLDNPDLYYLAIYDKAGKVRAVLAPGADRVNVVTGLADKVANYSGCGAIGFAPGGH